MLMSLEQIRAIKKVGKQMADLRVANTDLKVGDLVQLKSGGPIMTVVGCMDNEIRCGFFTQQGPELWDDLGICCLPRASLQCVTPE